MPKAPIQRGLGPVLDEIPLESIPVDPNTSVKKENLTILTSYNILPKNENRIIVPGTPPILKPPRGPITVRPDSGRYIMNPNSHVFPKFPLEPLFRALLTSHPDFRFNNIDLVSDRRNLRLLLAFASGNTTAFRIEAEVVQSTVLLSAWSRKKIDFVKNFHGYGYEFEKAATVKPNHTQSCITHNRVIQYTLGPVKIVMRFEVDACIQPKGAAPEFRVRNRTRAPTGTRVFEVGELVAPSHIVEIKTGPVGKQLCIGKHISQMWFSQTPILCEGHYQDGGKFLPSTETNLEESGKLAKWEEVNQDKIRKLIGVLEMILQRLKNLTHKKVALVHEGSGVLKVYALQNPDNKGIPADLLEVWNKT